MSARLNPEQLAAVQHPWDRPLKVIAGAGTGKTTILVQRYIYLLANGLRPENLLALTFTNKASAEMLERLKAAVPEFDPASAWVTTFHAFALRILRSEAFIAGVDPRFKVLDEAGARLAYERACRDFLSGRLHNEYFRPDTLTKVRFDKPALMEDVFGLIGRLKDMAVGPDGFMQCCLKAHPSYFEAMKNAIRALPAGKGARPDELLERASREYQYEQEMAATVYTLYVRYQQELERRRALDFGDLVQRACRVLETNPERRRRYQHLFRHILIDEFQDTSEAQFALIRLLARDERLSNVTVVGDDKQAIYGWRNARVENVRDFTADLWGGRSLTVNRNYRSYGEILHVAGDAIARSVLFSDRAEETQLLPEMNGYREEPAVFAYRGPDEPRFIAEQVRNALSAGYNPQEIVILTRSLRGIQPIEDALQGEGIPQRTVGGMGFYDREEVKDVLSFLRLAEDPLDSLALLRILTRPPYRVSDRFLSELVRLAQAAESEAPPELWDYLARAGNLPDFESRQAGVAQVRRLTAALDELRRLRDQVSPQELVIHAFRTTGYSRYLETLPERERSRSEANLHKLASLSSEFTRGNPGATLRDFLSHVETAVRYEVIEGEADVHSGGAVRIMTVHQSKGLEFPVVFVAKVAPGSFPATFHRQAFGFDPALGLICSRIFGEYSLKAEPHAFDRHPEAYAGMRNPSAEARAAQLEEERRLWYVALTRAQKLLFVSGPDPKKKGSDFLSEVAGLLRENPRCGAVLHEPVRLAPVEASRLIHEEAAASRESRTGFLPLHCPAAPATPAGSVALSFSSLRVFLHCPLRYYFIYRWRFPLDRKSRGGDGPGYDPALLGTAVHRALAQGRRSAKQDPQVYLTAFTDACRSLGIATQDILTTYVPTVEQWLEAYVSGPLGQVIPQECWEKEFSLEAGAPSTTIRFSGFIDHLMPRDDGRWDILDYKTNRELNEGELRDYSLQLQWYALACRESLGIEPGRLLIYHLPSRSLITVDSSTGALKDAKHLLIKSGEAVAEGRKDIDFGLDGRGCFHCPVSLCPERVRDEALLAEFDIDGDLALDPGV